LGGGGNTHRRLSIGCGLAALACLALAGVVAAIGGGLGAPTSPGVNAGAGAGFTPAPPATSTASPTLSPSPLITPNPTITSNPGNSPIIIAPSTHPRVTPVPTAAPAR